MRTCQECGAENPADAALCQECGEALDEGVTGPQARLTEAGYDPDEERELFERRYGIDVGDRTVEEYLDHLSRQDYSLTVWIGVIVVAEIAGVGLFLLELFLEFDPAVAPGLAFPAISLLLSLGILADTRAVGLFRPWAKIRWAYVLIAAIPLVGHIAAFLYLVLRRLMHQETTEHRRRLLDAGLELPGRQ